MKPTNLSIVYIYAATQSEAQRQMCIRGKGNPHESFETQQEHSTNTETKPIYVFAKPESLQKSNEDINISNQTKGVFTPRIIVRHAMPRQLFSQEYASSHIQNEFTLIQTKVVWANTATQVHSLTLGFTHTNQLILFGPKRPHRSITCNTAK